MSIYRLVLRIRVEASEGSCLIALGGKFGCEPSKALGLITEAAKLGLQIVGISFHVGTGCKVSEPYARGIHIAAKLFLEAKQLGIYLQYLDIGGGFPGDSPSIFEEVSSI